MRSRSTNLRTKVIALLVSLVALWSFAAWVTLRDGVNLLGVQTIDTQIVGPSEPVLLALQVERRLAVAYLGAPNASRREALDTARQAVDESAAKFKTSARSWRAQLASDADAEQQVAAAIEAVDALGGTRTSVDDRAIDRGSAEQAYTALIDTLFQLYDVVGGLDDPEIEEDTRHLIELYRVRELMSQEDALLSGALATGRMTIDEQTRFAQLVAGQRFLANRALTQLRESDKARFSEVVNSPAFTRLRSLEDRIVSSDRSKARPGVTAQEWSRAADAALTDLQNMVLGSGDALVERATPFAVWVIVRLVLAAGLGLLAVIASTVVSVTTARALVAQLQRLREAARQLADERLPSIVDRLGRGEMVDVATEAPPLDFGADEIGQVGEAFNRVQETAIRTAVEQAELRRSVRDVFLSLARRTQGLVHRQVTLLDAMERREQDAEELEDLFRVDHLATRMRRNAENLIVLSGSVPGRAWRRDVPMLDVARAAAQEVEDYTRVTVRPFGSVGLAGRAVSDVTHLLAELIENALSFSPPHTEVEVRGQLVARGFAIEIEDRGLGMSDEEIAAANERIASPTEFNLSNANQLGLFVVSHLAARHHIGVQLKASPYGGTTAVVLIPTELVATAEALASASRETESSVRTGADGSLPDDVQPRAAARTDGPIAVAEPPATHRPTVEMPAVAQRMPLRRAVDDHATIEAPTPEPTAPEERTEQRQTRTEHGLPVRVRQASIAPQLRSDPDALQDPVEATPSMSPDRVRNRMSSYQSGTQRGRADARRLSDEEDEQGLDAGGPPATETER
ncbi:nitrate- and nitrite sensing domain-containing protein [Micromonospora sp. NPDC050200]|uniref:sensor histidine kinase n=1 Tax=Micromonospora sp. NPDC050200 TaxID=3155664 RepID=UPI0033DFB69E